VEQSHQGGKAKMQDAISCLSVRKTIRPQNYSSGNYCARKTAWDTFNPVCAKEKWQNRPPALPAPQPFDPQPLTPNTQLIVLDTNVVLDIFHFHDPAVAPLGAHLAAGRLVCLGDAYTLAEFERVLTYARLAIPVVQAEEILRAYRALVRFSPGSGSPYALPACRDPDDQPFLELAAREKARWLVSKDKKILELAYSRRYALPFAILSPHRLRDFF
jgi:putative PIN family toxin of toxin-antitoxin system